MIKKWVYLTIEEGRIVVDVGDFDGERADALERWVTLIGGFYGDRDKLAVVAFAVKHFVGEDLARFFVDGEFGTLLVGLLDDGILDLTVDTFIGVGGLDADDGAAVWRTFLDLGTVRGTIRKDGFVVVDVSDEDDHNSCRRVSWSARASRVTAASAVVDGRDVEFVLVAIEADGSVVQTNHTRQFFNDELT